MSERILILDFGSQLTQLIARRVREAGVYSEIAAYDKAEEALARLRPKGVILSGGPGSVADRESPELPAAVLEAEIPILAICYGQQALVHRLGGRVEASDHQEFGRAFLDVVETCRLFDGVWALGAREQVWMSHGDRVVALPEGFRVVGTSDGAPCAAIADDERGFYGLQFHPEVAHTPHGAALIGNFVADVCACACDWSVAAFKEAKIAELRRQIGREKVICGLSGGVDSAVVALLVHEAVGEQLTCVFVDTGLLRQDEGAQVVDLFRRQYNIPLIHRDASEHFMAALEGVEDPETKRKRVGITFIDIFQEEAQKVGDAAFLAQGTLYPDVVESVSAGGGPSATIKSHHNVGGLPERMNLDLVEPLRELFKDEVRLLGEELGLHEGFVRRHPFPGPGLAIRIPGEVTRDKADILRKADAIYLEELWRAGLYHAIWQAFAVLLPVRTVGVMGDSRTYEFVAALRAVTSVDGMTADSYPFDHGFLSSVATRIVNEVRGINRVVYDVTSKPPGTIEWE